MPKAKDNKKTLTTKLVQCNLKNIKEITYKDLCEKLKQPYYSGYQKKKQIEDFKRFFDLEEKNRKIYIKELYKKEKPLPINPASNRSIYVKYIECILLQYLSKHDGEPVYFSPKKLWLHLGMINDDFIKFSNSKQYHRLTDENNNISYNDVKDFYYRCTYSFPTIIKSSLNSLKRRCLIDYDKLYRIGIINEETGFVEYRDALESERIYINHIKRSILDEYGFEEELDIFRNDKRNEYYEKLNEKFKNDMNWFNVYEAYKLLYTKKDVLKALSSDKIKLEKLGLNEAIITKMDKQAETLYDKKIEAETNGLAPKKNYHDNYIASQCLLSNRLLKIY